jgi:hypothetical protein
VQKGILPAENYKTDSCYGPAKMEDDSYHHGKRLRDALLKIKVLPLASINYIILKQKVKS